MELKTEVPALESQVPTGPLSRPRAFMLIAQRIPCEALSDTSHSPERFQQNA